MLPVIPADRKWMPAVRLVLPPLPSLTGTWRSPPRTAQCEMSYDPKAAQGTAIHDSHQRFRSSFEFPITPLYDDVNSTHHKGEDQCGTPPKPDNRPSANRFGKAVDDQMLVCPQQ